MDIADLTSSLKILHHNGICFNVEERFQLEMALQNLLNNSQASDFEELLFWGRVSGVKADYYIALGLCYKERYEFPEKKFYWCSKNNGMVFEAFPALNDQHKEKYDKLANQLFTGDAKLIHEKVEEVPNPEEEAKKAAEKLAREQNELASTEEEDPKSLIVRVNLKEIDRLNYHVRAIENDCHIIPQGSMKLTPAHEVERNEAFTGLPPKEFSNLDFYSHFRNVQDQTKKENLEADDAIFQRNFLDDVSSDKPHGCWSLQKDGSGMLAIIRNHLWKGYTSYHAVGTQQHGGIYVGDGLKNLNMCFMM